MDDVYEAEAMQSGGDETSVPSVQESGARRLAGAADVCELLSVAFRFPEEDALAVALVDGRFAADAQGAFSDAGAPAEALAASDKLLASFRDLNAAALQRDLRRGYSLLFLAPGAKVPVWPYEAPFRYRAKGRAGVPSLFRSPVTLEVAASMSEVGFKPVDATEPPDSVADELAFLSALLATAAAALQGGEEPVAQNRLGKARRFWNDHPGQWLPAFMEQVQQESPLRKGASPYGLLAQWGALVLSVLSFLGNAAEGARV